MNASSVKCPICSTDLSRPRSGFLLHCRGCGFSWMEENRERLKPAPEVESAEAVWKHSKTALFLSGLDTLEKLLPQKGRLLDIGTGFGYFLDLARARGWDVSGIEIEKKAVEFARKTYNLEIFDKPAADMGFAGNSYDAVTLWIVLEQLPDPFGELRNILRILKPGGVVYIRAYNHAFHRIIYGVSALIGPLLGMSPSIIHAYNFTPKSLRKLLENTGFRGIRLVNSPASSGDPYATGGILGRGFVVFAKRAVFALARAIAAATMNRVLLASTLIATAIKPK